MAAPAARRRGRRRDSAVMPPIIVRFCWREHRVRGTGCRHRAAGDGCGPPGPPVRRRNVHASRPRPATSPRHRSTALQAIRAPVAAAAGRRARLSASTTRVNVSSAGAEASTAGVAAPAAGVDLAATAVQVSTARAEVARAGVELSAPGYQVKKPTFSRSTAGVNVSTPPFQGSRPGAPVSGLTSKAPHVRLSVANFGLKASGVMVMVSAATLRDSSLRPQISRR
jgi:hypothetical protein